MCLLRCLIVPHMHSFIDDVQTQTVPIADCQVHFRAHTNIHVESVQSRLRRHVDANIHKHMKCYTRNSL